jgi:beta-phosphoglucomutase family hydrolase
MMVARELLNKATGVIFDMDGVLVDTEPIHMLIEKQIFEEIGIDVDDSYHETFVGRSSKEMWMEIVEKFGLEMLPEQLVARKKEAYITYLGTLPAMPVIEGVEALLSDLALKGKKLALASSSGMSNIRFIIERSGLDKYFDVVVSGQDLPRSKPDPAIFLLAAKKLGVLPKDCVVIEDAYAGVKAAKSAGMACIGFAPQMMYGQNLSMADTIISSYDGLLQ